MASLREIPDLIVVDDDALDRASLQQALRSHYQVHAFADAESAERLLAHRPVDLAVLDLHLATTNGLEVLERWSSKFPHLSTVFCSGEPRVDVAMECIRRGAKDFICKPFTPSQLAILLDRVHPPRDSEPVDFIGSSPESRRVLEVLTTVSKHHDIRVLLVGETGTGKEVAARWLSTHHPSRRNGLGGSLRPKKRPFVGVNVAAIPENLFEAELFGVEKGAYTDAKVSRPGKLELAQHGDLFLDEIGDLPLHCQAKLLRVLNEGSVERVGSHKSLPLRTRILSATNRDLPQAIRSGNFREDLYFRLADVCIRIPPLRERRSDIPELAQFFLKKHAPDRHAFFDGQALEALQNYDWPGNVRELESTVKRALIFNAGNELRRIDFPYRGARPLASLTCREWTGPTRTERPSHEALEEALHRMGGNARATWEELGISRATFYRWRRENPQNSK